MENKLYLECTNIIFLDLKKTLIELKLQRHEDPVMMNIKMI